MIVSDDFKNINNIKRHQTVYKALKSVMESIHALSINTFDKKEFQKNPQLIDSPKCVNKINES